MDYNADTLAAAPPPLDLPKADSFKPSAELRRLQEQMAALFLRQQQRGGIIQPDSTVLLLTVSHICTSLTCDVYCVHTELLGLQQIKIKLLACLNIEIEVSCQSQHLLNLWLGTVNELNT